MTASAAGLRAGLVTPLAEMGLDLEDVRVQRAGRRELVRVVVDRDGGVDLDAIAEASQLISALLDAEPMASQFAGAYVLEVTSPGVDRPLTQPRHWRRAVGRLIEVSLVDGTSLTGRILRADQSGVVLLLADGTQATLEYPNLLRGVVQVEFQRPDEFGRIDQDDRPGQYESTQD
jgi:ribosome maturation factor RimP